MILELDSKYRIVSGKRDFTLQEKTDGTQARGRMKGKAKGGRWKDLGYWNRLDQVLRAYTRQKIRVSSAGSIEEVLSVLSQINAKIEGIGKRCVHLWGRNGESTS